MTHQLRNVSVFDDEYESLVDLSSQPISHSESNNSDNPTILSSSNPLNNDPQTRTYWRPSNELQNLYDRFQNNILKQWPRIAYLRVPTCNSCKKPETRFSFPYLSPMPVEITSVPLYIRKCLSPVYLHCSLGRMPNSNPYSEYRSLTGTMGYSRNSRALALYSETLGAFLEPENNNNSVNNSNYNQALQRAANWLSENNLYLHPFSNLLLQQNRNGPFPIAQHSQTNNEIPPVNSHKIIVPNYDFPDEIHNEDFHYTRLMAGFVQESDTLRLPIATHDPNLEPLLFPDLFTDGKGHFHDISNQSILENETRDETYGKYIKLRLTNIDSR
ncbi:10580_t:CDS:2 [Cetraspora pellucida]|uniref:10580_t:CDS:1 n=1 Tax=Cetraspora pellucida TaxID=1433469 RepID=A0A9N9JLQ4_9GLOM|nr:10580_t:CDS:2 [Cetraspora pellucida]